MSKLNPITKHKEFFGVPGVVAITVVLPIVCNAAYFLCNDKGCPVSWDLEVLMDQVRNTRLISTEATIVYLMWFCGLAILELIIPGTEVEGTTLRDGTKLKYKFNGTIVVCILSAVLSKRLVDTQGKLPELVFVYDHILELTNVAILFSFALATYVYVASFCHSKEPLLALGGNSGNPIFDWFIGRELNPRIGKFDIKLFCEMRPGLLLWFIINLSMMHHQIMKFGYLSDSMSLVVLFQAFYVFEGTFYESGLVSMIDITTDGFGFMLSFGDLALVPFTYSIQSRFLADHPVDLGWFKFGLIILVFMSGLAIFRLSNNEKAAFKQNSPSTKHLKYIETPTGSKLITSGWWGIARHINYFGDWLLSWAYCLPCALSTPVPYYYIVYFAILLIHRELRDEAKCAAKYGETWVKYKKLVPSRIVPGVY